MDNTTVVHEEISKVVGGRKYYLAERVTQNGMFGFWVDEHEKGCVMHGFNVSR